MNEIILKNTKKYVVSNFQEQIQEINFFIKSGYLPSDINTPEKAYTILKMGEALGVLPIIAFNNISVIQKKPTISPQLMLSLIKSSGLEEWTIIAKEKDLCSVTMKRKGKPEHSDFFSMEMARALKLDEKYNWKQQPDTMLQWRAVAKVARVVYPDLLMGLYTHEEMGSEDIEEPENNHIDTKSTFNTKQKDAPLKFENIPPKEKEGLWHWQVEEKKEEQPKMDQEVIDQINVELEKPKENPKVEQKHVAQMEKLIDDRDPKNGLKWWRLVFLPGRGCKNNALDLRKSEYKLFIELFNQPLTPAMMEESLEPFVTQAQLDRLFAQLGASLGNAQDREYWKNEVRKSLGIGSFEELAKKIYDEIYDQAKNVTFEEIRDMQANDEELPKVEIVRMTQVTYLKNQAKTLIGGMNDPFLKKIDEKTMSSGLMEKIHYDDLLSQIRTCKKDQKDAGIDSTKTVKKGA